jgi:hypothetical protein
VGDRDQAAPAIDARRHHRRAHLGQGPDPALGDARAGQAGRDRELVGHRIETWVGAVRPGHVAIGGGARDQLDDRVGGQAAGQLAASVAAHTVGDDEQAEVRARAHRVLVVGATSRDRSGGSGEVHGRG